MTELLITPSRALMLENIYEKKGVSFLCNEKEKVEIN